MTMRWMGSGVVAVGLVARIAGAVPSPVDPASLVGAWTIATTTVLLANQ